MAITQQEIEEKDARKAEKKAAKKARKEAEAQQQAGEQNSFLGNGHTYKAEKEDAKRGLSYVPPYRVDYEHHYGQEPQYVHSFMNGAPESNQFTKYPATHTASPLSQWRSAQQHLPAPVPHTPVTHSYHAYAQPTYAVAHPLTPPQHQQPYVYTPQAQQPAYQPRATYHAPQQAQTQPAYHAQAQAHPSLTDVHTRAAENPPTSWEHGTDPYTGRQYPWSRAQSSPYGGDPFTPVAVWTGKKYKYMSPMKAKAKEMEREAKAQEKAWKYGGM